ncbi:hypothetical protein E2C01_008271 [Portunus trituberculatus]|uniref:Uncharacterized protein n=1 Tax=Portunus trituberculatus TaxID=210409 RepID=A0A5B7D1B7_PORTR|nr:hypothetical protein [Portunus trituberculatus]
MARNIYHTDTPDSFAKKPPPLHFPELQIQAAHLTFALINAKISGARTGRGAGSRGGEAQLCSVPLQLWRGQSPGQPGTTRPPRR